MAQVTKILSIVLHISGTIRHMIFIHGTHLLNDNISRYFFILSKFWFSRSIGGKRAKNGAKWQKILSVVLRISGTIHDMNVSYGAHVSNDNISRYFFIFFTILIFNFLGCQGGERAENGLNWQKICLLHLIFQEPYHMIFIYGAHV